MDYCSSLNCFNILCHQGRTLCIQCDVDYTEHCNCHCDCYTNIILSNLHMTSQTAVLIIREINTELPVHNPIQLRLPSLEKQLKAELRDLEKRMRNIVNWSDLIEFCGTICGEQFKLHVSQVKNIPTIKVAVLTSYASSKYNFQQEDRHCLFDLAKSF